MGLPELCAGENGGMAEHGGEGDKWEREKGDFQNWPHGHHLLGLLFFKFRNYTPMFLKFNYDPKSVF